MVCRNTASAFSPSRSRLSPALSLYQIESNTRSAAVLGFLSARGGLASSTRKNMRLWNWDVVMFITPIAGRGGHGDGHPLRPAAPPLHRRQRSAVVSKSAITPLPGGATLTGATNQGKTSRYSIRHASTGQPYRALAACSCGHGLTNRTRSACRHRGRSFIESV